jgi:hypothetical protein
LPPVGIKGAASLHVFAGFFEKRPARCHPPIPRQGHPGLCHPWGSKVLRYYMFFHHQPAWARPSRWAENAQRSGRFFERRRPAPGRHRGSKVLRDCMSSPDFSRNAHRDASPIARWGHPAPCHPWGSKVLRDYMFLPDFSENAHGGTTPPYLVRGIRALATRGDQRCCVTTCFCRIFRKTPTEMPPPHTSLGASGPLPPVGIKGAALLHVFPASAGLGSAQPLGRKRPTFGPIFRTAPTGPRPTPGIKGAA